VSAEKQRKFKGKKKRKNVFKLNDNVLGNFFYIIDYLVFFKTGLSQYRLPFKMAVFWVVAHCSLLEFYRRFRGDYRPDDGGSKYL
jgi:hypothetical protein